MTDSSALAVDPIALLKALIRCPSVTPETAGVFDVLEDALVGLGFTVSRVVFEGNGSYPVENVFATIGGGARHLLFAGHTDVVPPGALDAWTHPPFEAEEADGAIYGRGAADMKSGIAAFVAAAATAIAAGAAQHGRISLAITNDEEADAVNGTARLLEWAVAQGHAFDFAIVGEPSATAAVGDSIKIGRRGSLNGRIVVTGTQGHVAYPDKAANPLPAVAEIVQVLSGRLDAGSAQFQPSNLEFTSVDVGNEVTNVIPGQAVARFNARYNDRWTPESLLANLRTRLVRTLEDHPGINADLQVVGRPSRSFVSPTSGAVALLSRVIAAETGSLPELSTGGGTSDARFIAQYCPVAELGLVGTSMHKADEHVAIADVHTLTRLYADFIVKFIAG